MLCCNDRETEVPPWVKRLTRTTVPYVVVLPGATPTSEASFLSRCCTPLLHSEPCWFRHGPRVQGAIPASNSIGPESIGRSFEQKS